ncbi:MAG TPA: 23S rRNA (uracil(1939)-C(5))-methyltransferase RlmD [Bacteroidetes bacterium]|nr:23S rRNA (uracil(1939)-C(5))-methyltransferase RlmD [Bacteroidota bacterium]
MARRKKRSLPLLENVEIVDAGAEGKAVARVDEKVLFVPFAAPGDVADVQVVKKKRHFLEGRITALKKASPYRMEPKCQHFGLCGGCKWQHMDYRYQKQFKQKQVKDALDRIAKVPYPEIKEIIGSENIYFYRNKLEFTFSNRKWLTEYDPMASEEAPLETRGLGFHLPGKFDKVLDIETCYLQKEPSNAIRLAVKKYAIENDFSFYNAREQHGLLRNMIIRTSTTGDLMVVLIFGEDAPGSIQKLLTFLSGAFPQITSLTYVINTKKNDAIYDLEVKLFKGKDYNLEVMQPARPGRKPLYFKVGPKSFYQTNPEQAQKLYQVAHDFAGFTGNERVYDLYTGTGTIALFIAPSVKKVVGIESVEEAVADARKNAAENGIENVEFHAGDMAKLLDEEFFASHGRPDVLLTDPPRAGMHPKVIRQILSAAPEKIVYVSCNPATQARDIALLDKKYRIEKVQPVDMFPQTHHVENVVLLLKK